MAAKQRAVLGADRFRSRQADGLTKKGKVASEPDVSEADIRRGCLSDWMELSVHLAPSRKHKAVPRGLQDRFACSVRHYLTQSIFQQGKENERPKARQSEMPVALAVHEVHEGAEGILIRSVVQGPSFDPRLPDGSVVRMLLHQKHPALQAVPLGPGTAIQVVNFSLIQADACNGALMLPLEVIPK
mmetsp:Transcript_105117/g.250249  ORF Transcript_105117/g.250249 Transcript_105117/m.250249 type:complete len:186 (-) Transcript_105117:139-696(-)